MVFESPFKHAEVEANVSCDMDCFGCDRFSDVTTAPNMKLSQMKLFIDESLELGWEWERIRILGGEPTLHSQFKEFVEELLRYRQSFPNVFLQILSNGLGKLSKYKSWLIENRVDPHVEAKSYGVQPSWFRNTRLVPADDPNCPAELPPCGIFHIRGCGIAVTRTGYYLDGAGAAVARVAGIDIGVQHLRDVTYESMYNQSRPLCKLCGHWTPPGTTVENLEPGKVSVTGKITGPTWLKYLDAYATNKPKMTIFGEQ